MQRRHRHATRRLHLEVLEPRQLLSRSDEVLRLAAAAMPSRTATEGGPLNLTGAEHDLIAEQIVHRPRLAARQGLGTLAAMMAGTGATPLTTAGVPRSTWSCRSTLVTPRGITSVRS